MEKKLTDKFISKIVKEMDKKTLRQLAKENDVSYDYLRKCVNTYQDIHNASDVNSEKQHVPPELYKEFVAECKALRKIISPEELDKIKLVKCGEVAVYKKVRKLK